MDLKARVAACDRLHSAGDPVAAARSGGHRDGHDTIGHASRAYPFQFLSGQASGKAGIGGAVD